MKTIENFELTILPTDSIVHADLLMDHYVGNEIVVNCQNKNVMGENLIEIHPGAFTSSKAFTKYFTIKLCDISRLKFYISSRFRKVMETFI